MTEQQTKLETDLGADSAAVSAIGTQIADIGQKLTDYFNNHPAVDLTGADATANTMFQQLQAAGAALSSIQASIPAAAPAPTP